MRINKFVAQATGISRRAADEAIKAERVTINGQVAELGDDVNDAVFVRLDDQLITLNQAKTTVMLNKPVGYVCSRNGQGSATIYELLPPSYESLKPVGRLDKDSSGLILLTNDGDLANELNAMTPADRVAAMKQAQAEVTTKKVSIPKFDRSPKAIAQRETRVHETAQQFRDLLESRREISRIPAIPAGSLELRYHDAILLGEITSAPKPRGLFALPYVMELGEDREDARATTTFGLDLVEHRLQDAIEWPDATQLVKRYVLPDAEAVNIHDAAVYRQFDGFSGMLGEVVELNLVPSPAA